MDPQDITLSDPSTVSTLEHKIETTGRAERPKTARADREVRVLIRSVIISSNFSIGKINFLLTDDGLI